MISDYSFDFYNLVKLIENGVGKSKRKAGQVSNTDYTQNNSGPVNLFKELGIRRAM